MTDETDRDPSDVIEADPPDAEVIEAFERERAHARDPDRRRALEEYQRAFQSGTISKEAAVTVLTVDSKSDAEQFLD